MSTVLKQSAKMHNKMKLNLYSKSKNYDKNTIYRVPEIVSKSAAGYWHKTEVYTQPFPS
jgi:glutamate formiminotransferase